MSFHSPFAAKLSQIPVESREVTVLGSRTKYWIYGDSDAATTVVIAHGYRGEHHGLEPVIAQLPDIRWIGADMPGFGESTPMTEAPHGIDGYARWLTGFMDSLALSGSAVLLGHSFGSIISARAISAGLHPRALILVNPLAISGLDGPNARATKITVAFYRLAGRLPEPIGLWMLRHWLIVHFVNVSLTKTRDKALRAWIFREHHTFFNRFASRDLVVEAFEASISAHVSQFSSDITMPTLLLAAELDDITPIEAVRDLRDAIPSASLTVLPDVGHLIHYEVPELAANAIGSFLDTLQTQRPG